MELAASAALAAFVLDEAPAPDLLEISLRGELDPSQVPDKGRGDEVPAARLPGDTGKDTPTACSGQGAEVMGHNPAGMMAGALVCHKLHAGDKSRRNGAVARPLVLIRECCVPFTVQSDDSPGQQRNKTAREAGIVVTGCKGWAVKH